MHARMRKDGAQQLHPSTEGTHAWHWREWTTTAIPEADKGEQIREQFAPVREDIAHQVLVREVIPCTGVGDSGVQANAVTTTAQIPSKPDIVAVGNPRTLEGDLHALILAKQA